MTDSQKKPPRLTHERKRMDLLRLSNQMEAIYRERSPYSLDQLVNATPWASTCVCGKEEFDRRQRTTTHADAHFHFENAA